MNYDTYLFSCLLKEYDQEFANKPYDEQFDLIAIYWKEFEQSYFNDSSENLYECLTNYFCENANLNYKEI